MDPYSTMKLRITLRENPVLNAVDQGRHIHHHFTLRENLVERFKRAKQQISPFLDKPNFQFIDDWHRDALLDIFASELVTNMSNNIADYVWEELRPERYKTLVLQPAPGRTLEQIRDYIQSFSNTSTLLKNIFAKELRQLQFEATDEKLILHDGSTQTAITASKVIECMVSRGDVSESHGDLEAIVDLAFPELFFALRQLRSSHFSIAATGNHRRCRFSIAATADHSKAIATPVGRNDNAIARIRRSERRLTTTGEVKPSWREYTALFATFIVSILMLVLGIWQNWARRSNILERVFDGTGLFALTAGVMLAIISRRLDFYDLVSIILRNKRLLQSYGELLSVLNLTDADVKSALTFEDVHVPPISSEWTSYAFQKHEGSFNPFSGLDTDAEDTNIIVGNKSALSRGRDHIRYYSANQSSGMWYLTASDDALFRIVTDGDQKIVR